MVDGSRCRWRSARLLGYRWPDRSRTMLDGLADADGIVCLPAVGGEPPAADRLRSCWPRRTGSVVAGDAGRAAGGGGGQAGDLAGWLRDEFFKAALQGVPEPAVRVARLGRSAGRVLGVGELPPAGPDDAGEADVHVPRAGGSSGSAPRPDGGVAGAEARLAAALDLQRKLELILEGEPPYDIYVRWKTSG